MMPLRSGGSSLPSIVCVLPVPVCPYAKMVPLYPSSVEWMIGSAVSVKTSVCEQFQSNTRSKVKVLGVSEDLSLCRPSDLDLVRITYRAHAARSGAEPGRAGVRHQSACERGGRAM